ncbi:phage antirepressor N-terminal domain-containing protein [Azotobacter chroococcum]|uniref:phage antirepressor N-terminal domain-containing protein n=1 Tax=Azotobacter chroococcum TaxID=353 RepID=UPI00146B64B4|nr:phage antirepressor N-terminal domain-containing protein [Azotobacter chroococcum]
MKKPQVLATPGASEDNVKTNEEMNVMSKNSTAAAQIIPFRQAKLLLVDQGGEPFVPMKPVVEGMGLSWASQTVKLNGNQARWGVSIIEIPSSSGIQSYLCIPLRKLFGWMNTIHPSKVRKDLRDGIIAYQNECDDVLWAYWNEGKAVRNDDRTVETVLNSTIGTDGFHMLGAVLDGKVRHLPAKARQRAKMHVWSQVHKAFSVVSAEDIPASSLDAARNFIGSYTLPLEGEWIEREKPAEATRLDIHFPVSRWLKDCPSFAKAQEMEAPGRLLISPRMLYGMDFLSPTLRLLNDLARAGYNVEACKLETMAARDLVQRLSSDLCEIQRLCGVSMQQGIRFQIAKEVAA